MATKKIGTATKATKAKEAPAPAPAKAPKPWGHIPSQVPLFEQFSNIQKSMGEAHGVLKADIEEIMAPIRGEELEDVVLDPLRAFVDFENPEQAAVFSGVVSNLEGRVDNCINGVIGVTSKAGKLAEEAVNSLEDLEEKMRKLRLEMREGSFALRLLLEGDEAEIAKTTRMLPQDFKALRELLEAIENFG